jgi:hypothetical protein
MEDGVTDNAAGVQHFTLVATFTGAAGQLIARAGSTSFVYGDTDGDRAADLTIELTGNKALTGGDFILA